MLRDLYAKAATLTDTIQKAAARNDQHAVKGLVELGRVNDADTLEGLSALHVASAAGYTELVSYLLASGADVARFTHWSKRTPLLMAAANGHAEVVQLLLARDADPDAATTSKNTALMRASLRGHVDVVGLLLAAGANTGATNMEGCTALMRAAKAGQYEVASLLLSAGADASVRDHRGRSALDLALLEKHALVVALLVNTTTAAAATPPPPGGSVGCEVRLRDRAWAVAATARTSDSAAAEQPLPPSSAPPSTAAQSFEPTFSGDAVPSSLNPPGRWDVFVSHTQRSGVATTLASEIYACFRERGSDVWLDVKMGNQSETAMREGVERSTLVIAVITDVYSDSHFSLSTAKSGGAGRGGVPAGSAAVGDAGASQAGVGFFERPYCLQELRWAVAAGVPLQPVVAAHDKKRIAELLAGCPDPSVRTALAETTVVHLDRSGADYLAVGIGRIAASLAQAARRRGERPPPQPPGHGLYSTSGSTV